MQNSTVRSSDVASCSCLVSVVHARRQTCLQEGVLQLQLQLLVVVGAGTDILLLCASTYVLTRHPAGRLVAWVKQQVGVGLRGVSCALSTCRLLADVDAPCHGNHLQLRRRAWQQASSVALLCQQWQALGPRTHPAARKQDRFWLARQQCGSRQLVP